MTPKQPVLPKSAVLLAVMLVSVAGCTGSSNGGAETSPNAAATADGSTKKASSSGDSMSDTVIIKTNRGEITVELDRAKAPVTVENFLSYVEDKFYDGTIFHRVIPGFMIQGGGFEPNGKQKTTGTPIKNEADNGLKNEKGSIAMARTSVVDSATSQFFINVVDNAFLDHKSKDDRGYGYAVFGIVVGGMDIVKAIETTPTRNQGGAMANAPVEPVIIESIRRK